MKYLPAGRQNFKEIIEEDLLYLDKTRQIYELLNNGKFYFLSRPRRFGKSLLLSVFRYLFSGKKQVFEDLYIAQETDYAFEEYPVIQFNFADYGAEVTNLKEVLSADIQRKAKDFKMEVDMVSLSTQFMTLVQNIATKGKPVVLLIDEYDKPIVDFLTEPEKAKKNQQILRQFFGPLKGLDSLGHLRFLFITGVSKFSKVSLFSDLNNLTDLSIHALSHDLLGITQKELEQNFASHIEKAALKFQLSKEDLLEAMKTWYNGYSYDGKIRLYNPFSILHFFQNYHFGNYWFDTGTPTFLVKTIRDRGIDPREYEETGVNEAFLTRFSLEDLNMTGLLFQTGYLTIKRIEYRNLVARYFLGYPNREVRNAMMYNLAKAFTYTSASTLSTSLLKMQDGLEEGNMTLFIEHLRIILSDLKYNWQPPKQYKTTEELFRMWEGYFHTILYLITSYMDMFVDAEVSHSKGRLDLIAETEHYIYLMEFKMDGKTENAIAQIKERAYATPYKNRSKTVFLVGINFSNEERNVESWEAEKWT
ncbi:MAG: AAA family ATPase [Bacteroidota bacterium]